jgi:hypothetical protein
MSVRVWLIAACGVAAVADAARADTCIASIGNGTGDVLVSVTVRADFAPPGSEADRNLALTLPRPLAKNETAALRWQCPTSKISYTATGTFANGIRRRSAPFTPLPSAAGAPETAWIE